MRKLFFYFLFTILIFSGISCNKEDETCQEKIQEDCNCIMIYQPVCGCNGKTYGNGCTAQCSGISEFVEGECK